MLLLQILSVAYAQSPAITNGLNWLNSTQSADGSWGSDVSATDSVQATSAAIESLAVLNNTASPNYVNAANWLTAQEVDTTRYFAERLSILPTFTADKDTILLSFDQLSHAWGSYSSFTINNLDTALALQALKASNYSDTTLIGQSLNYLNQNQNSDGGWGFRAASEALQADESNAYVTAIVLRTLAVYDSTFKMTDSILKASEYLLAKQNTDGGFGSSPSNIYETALSVMSLIESGKGSSLGHSERDSIFDIDTSIGR